MSRLALFSVRSLGLANKGTVAIDCAIRWSPSSLARMRGERPTAGSDEGNYRIFVFTVCGFVLWLSKTIKPLDVVYFDEGLPGRKSLSQGELKHPKSSGTIEFVEKIAQA